MSFPLRYATLLDGAFVIRKLEARLGRFPTAEDIRALAVSIDAHEYVSEFSRLRLRIGLDIARLALTQSVQAIVVVTGNIDLVPAFKFARRDGLRVFPCHLGHRIRRELMTHADREIRVRLSKSELAACAPEQQAA